MPTFFEVVEPKLTSIQSHVEAIKQRAQASGAFPDILPELAAVVDEAKRVHGLTELMLVHYRLND